MISSACSNGVKRRLILAECLEIEPRRETLDAGDIVEDILDRRVRLSEGKHGLFLDGALQPLRADRLCDDIDRASEDIADASDKRIEATEIREAAIRRFGPQANGHVDVRELGLVPRATEPKRDNLSTPAALNSVS